MLNERLEKDISSLTLNDLTPFMYDFINKHTYIQSKEIAKAYLIEKYNVSHYNLKIIYSKSVRILAYKLNYFIRYLKKANMIVKYNANYYKIINRNDMNLEDFKENINNYINNNNKIKKGKSGNGIIKFERFIRGCEKDLCLRISIPVEEIRKHNLIKNTKVRVIIERL